MVMRKQEIINDIQSFAKDSKSLTPAEVVGKLKCFLMKNDADIVRAFTVNPINVIGEYGVISYGNIRQLIWNHGFFSPKDTPYITRVLNEKPQPYYLHGIYNHGRDKTKHDFNLIDQDDVNNIVNRIMDDLNGKSKVFNATVAKCQAQEQQA